MFRISKDNPAFYLTAVTKDRLPIFRTAAFAELMCSALAEARTSAGFLILAYVIMFDHIHIVTAEATGRNIHYGSGMPIHDYSGTTKCYGNGYNTPI